MVFHNDWLQNHCRISFKRMTYDICSLCQFFTVMSCHIGSGMPNLCKFDEDFVALLGEMADKIGVKTLLWFELESKQ